MKDSEILDLMGRGLAWENVTKAKTNSAGRSLLEIAPRVAAMEAVAESLSKDAERYRWLRSRDLDAIVEGGIFAGKVPDNIVLNGDDLDREIDAAMLNTPNDLGEGRERGILREASSGEAATSTDGLGATAHD